MVTWVPSVPHKTSLEAGPFGYPDDNYIRMANAELDKIYIPAAQVLLGGATATSKDDYEEEEEEIIVNASGVDYAPLYGRPRYGTFLWE